MKNMFRIVSDNDPVEIEMSEDILDLALMIGTYIDENFDASDFFTLGDAYHDDVKMLMRQLRKKKDALTSEGDTIGFGFDKESYRLFEALFSYGRNFWDDIGSDEDHDQICLAADEIFRKI